MYLAGIMKPNNLIDDQEDGNDLVTRIVVLEVFG